MHRSSAGSGWARRAAALAITFVTVAAVGRFARQRDDPTDMRVLINLPAARLDVWVDDQIAYSYTVAVGAPRYPTPVGEYAIDVITLNPWWHPPDSDWASDEKPTPPGRNNPMGRVKLNFAPFYFLHGTPDTSSLGQPRSHGCIRMRNADAIELARVVTEWAGSKTAIDIDEVLATRTTRTFALTRKVPLRIIYQRFEAIDTLVTLHPDPYRKGKPSLADAIAELGIDGLSGPVDTARLRALLNRPAKRRVIVPRSTIVQGP